jgi:hypothetical protein
MSYWTKPMKIGFFEYKGISEIPCAVAPLNIYEQIVTKQRAF